MKLTSNTLSILKNFGIINQGIYFKKGNILKTMSPNKNIIASTEITEDIPCNFGVYDLNNFLSVVSLHKDEPVFEFDEKHVLIIGNNSRSKIKYRFCDVSMIVTPPEKDLTMPEAEIAFDLTLDDFSWIMKAAGVLSSPQISVESDGEKILIVTNDVKNDSAHTEALEIGIGNGAKFSMIFKTENLCKLLPGSYSVKISSQGVSHFVNTNIKLQYYVAVEMGSYYNKGV